MTLRTPQQTASRFLAVACAAWVGAALLAGCGGPKDKPATQTAAKVNKEEITVHQINAVLAQQRTTPGEQADQAARRVLERLIDQELAVQKAAELKLDRDPKVVQAIESARRDIIARAYAEHAAEAAPKPAPEEIRKYYDANPALFRDRRVYQLQEIAIQAEPGQVETLRAKLKASKGVNEFIDYLKANDFKFSGSQAVRSAEQVPLALLPSLAAMKDGQMVINATPTGANVLVLVSSRTQPVDEQRAGKAIEQFLANELKRKAVAGDLKALRATAKIEYVGRYAGSAPVVEAPQSPTPAEVAASAAAMTDGKSGTLRAGTKPAAGVAGAAAWDAPESGANAASGADAATINKGLGLK